MFAAQTQDWVFQAQDLPHGSGSGATHGKNSALQAVASDGRSSANAQGEIGLPLLGTTANGQGASGADSNNNNTHAGGGSLPVVLRLSNWLEKCTLEPIVAPWQLQQERFLQQHAPLQSEAGRTIAAELAYPLSMT